MVCTHFYFTLPNSWVWMSFNSYLLKSNSRNHSRPALHVSYGWLAYVLLHTYNLDACDQISLGNSCSSKLLMFEIWFDHIIFSQNICVLGDFIWKFENPLQSSSSICRSPTKAIWWVVLQTLIHICCLLLHWDLSNCCYTCENSLHAFVIKIHVHTISPCFASTLEVSIVSSIHSTK
jgi:hypothetical protein